MPRVIPKVGVERVLKVKARASSRNDKHPRRFRADSGTLSNREARINDRLRHRQLCWLSKEVELMIALAEKCLESLQHWIEQLEKR